MSAPTAPVEAQPGPLDRGRLRARLAAKETVIGTFLGLGAPIVAEVVVSAGLDFVLLDLEHGSGAEDQVGGTVVATAAYAASTLVRVETADRIRIGRALDAGAAGVMLPRQESAAHVRESLSHLYVPQRGDRGVAGYTRAGRWGQDPTSLKRAIDQTVGVVQIETLGALADVDEIAAIDGVDVLFVGPSDLSWALGTPGDLTSDAFQDALRQVCAAGEKHGKTCGVLAQTPELAQRYLDAGFRFILLGSDGSLLASTISSSLAVISR